RRSPSAADSRRRRSARAEPVLRREPNRTPARVRRFVAWSSPLRPGAIRGGAVRRCYCHAREKRGAFPRAAELKLTDWALPLSFPCSADSRGGMRRGETNRDRAAKSAPTVIRRRAGAGADEPGSGRVSGALTKKSPRWPLASLASAAAAERRVAALPESTAARPAQRSDAMRLTAEVERLERELAAARAQMAALEARADTDPLTDLLNRRGFERAL